MDVACLWLFEVHQLGQLAGSPSVFFYVWALVQIGDRWSFFSQRISRPIGARKQSSPNSKKTDGKKKTNALATKS